MNLYKLCYKKTKTAPEHRRDYDYCYAFVAARTAQHAIEQLNEKHPELWSYCDEQTISISPAEYEFITPCEYEA